MLAPNTSKDLEAELEAANQAWGAAFAKQKAAAQAVIKAQSLRDEAIRREATFATLDDEIARCKVEAVKTFAAGGDRPDGTLPPNLQARIKARTEAQEQVASYTAAAASLETELDAEIRNTQAAKWAAGQAARVVATLENEQDAAALVRARHEVWRLTDKIQGFARVRLPAYEVGKAPQLGKVSYEVQTILAAGNERPARAGNLQDPVDRAHEEWQARLAALMRDPERSQ